MAHIIVGLGNPGDEYKDTRHNTGRILLHMFGDAHDAVWKFDAKANAEKANIKIGTKTVILVLPNTFMNNSGKAVKPFVESVKQAEKLLVIYDDLDLPFGSTKMSFNKSSGGHKGVESIIKAVKTEKFARIRVGISPTTPSGKIKKPKGEEAVTKVILGSFKPAEMLTLKKISKSTGEAIENFVEKGIELAMSQFN